VNGHVADLAELYAVGSLDERERDRVDAHVLECETCAAQIGAAEAAVAALMTERAPSPVLDARVHRAFAAPPSAYRRFWMGLAAAAFVAGLLPSLWFWSAARNSAAFTADREQAVRAMVGSHFAHAQFSALTPDAPKAKVIYARTGAWRFIVVDAGRAYTVAEQSSGGTVRLGEVHVQGGAAELYLANPPPARTLLLLDGTRPVAQATLPYRP
jgi:hypothetical protein